MTTMSPYQQAVIDWVIAHGTPMGTFGPAGRLAAEQARADLATTGVDYAASTSGDLNGQQWSHDTYDEATDHPGLWAQIVPLGSTPGRYDDYAHDAQVWFVSGETTRLSLTDVITGVMEAGQVGDLYWRIKVAEAQDEQA